MEFSQIIEYAKNGLTMPKVSSQAEQLAYLTVICILDGFRNRTINGTQAKNQKEQAQQLFTAAKQEEAARRAVWKNQQENLQKTTVSAVQFWTVPRLMNRLRSKAPLPLLCASLICFI